MPTQRADCRRGPVRAGYAAVACLLLAGAAGFLTLAETGSSRDAEPPHLWAAVSQAPWILAGTGGTAVGLVAITAALTAPRKKKRPAGPTVDLLRSPYGRIEDTGVWPPSPPPWYDAKLRPGRVHERTPNADRIRALRTDRGLRR